MTDSAEEIPRLLLLVAPNETASDRLLTLMLDVGIRGATVVDAQSLETVARGAVSSPTSAFAGESLDSIADAAEGSGAVDSRESRQRLVLSLTNDRMIERLVEQIDQMPPTSRPVGVVVGVMERIGAL